MFVHGEAVQEDVSANNIINTFLPQFSDVGISWTILLISGKVQPVNGLSASDKIR